MAGHRHAGTPCPHKTKASCKLARRVAIGQCVAMVVRKRADPLPCGNWGIDRVNDQPYCGQHLNSILLEADRSYRDRGHREAVARDIDAFMKWATEHPSVHDRMPVRTS